MTDRQLLPTASGYVSLWEAIAVAIEFHQPRYVAGGAQGGLWADVAVLSKMPGQTGALHEGRHNLSSLSTKVSLAKYLASRAGGVEWDDVLAQAFRDVIRRHREGDPTMNLAARPEPPAIRYRVDRLLQEGQLTILYGEKDSGKSLLAMAVGYAVADGNDVLLGLAVEPGCVWYLDWETDEDTQADRLRWLARGLGAREIPAVQYRHMDRALTDDVERVRREVHEAGGGLVIVDSIGFACSGSLKEEEGARQFLQAARALGCTVLAVGQTRKPQPGERRQRMSIYGSAFFEYAARSIWRVQARREMDEPDLDIGVYHEKANNTARNRPLGYHVAVDTDARAFRIVPQDVRQVAELAEGGMTLGERIVDALTHSAGGMTSRDLAADLDTTVGAVQGTLARLGKRVIKRGYDGRQVVWAATADETYT